MRINEYRKCHLKLFWKKSHTFFSKFRGKTTLTEDLFLRETACEIKNGLIYSSFRAFYVYLKGIHFPERLLVSWVIFLISQLWQNLLVLKLSFKIYFHGLAWFNFKSSGMSRTAKVFCKMVLIYLIFSNSFLKNDTVVVVFNWDSLHARPISHYKAWSYENNEHKKIKAYKKSL